MTLIVCLKAKDCIVIAADSLTSRGGKIFSCTTEKLHQVATDAVTAGSGLSRVMGADWHSIFSNFLTPPSGTSIAVAASLLQAFFDEVMGQVPKNNIGACQGGNEFLLAGYDVINSGMAAMKLNRIGDRRQFETATMASDVSNHNFIEWIGDKKPVETYIENMTSRYVPGMSPSDALKFAIDAIIGGISASLAAGNHTIGGEFVSLALVSAGKVHLTHHSTGIPCTVMN